MSAGVCSFVHSNESNCLFCSLFVIKSERRKKKLNKVSRKKKLSRKIKLPPKRTNGRNDDRCLFRDGYETIFIILIQHRHAAQRGVPV